MLATASKKTSQSLSPLRVIPMGIKNEAVKDLILSEDILETMFVKEFAATPALTPSSNKDLSAQERTALILQKLMRHAPKGQKRDLYDSIYKKALKEFSLAESPPP